MLVINYIPKIQALDKALAMMAAIMENYSQAKFIYIFDIDLSNQIASSRYLFNMLVSLDATSIVVSGSGFNEEIEDVYAVEGAPYFSIVEKNDLKKTISECVTSYKSIESEGPVFFLTPKTAGGNNLGRQLACFLKKKERARIFSYFKSVHDQGNGLTTVYPADASERGGRKSLMLRVRARNILRILKKCLLLNYSRDPVDVYMCFNEMQKNLLSASGYDSKKLFVTGYPLLFSAWKKLLLESDDHAQFKKSSCDIVLFTRGETPGRPSDQNVVPTDTLIAMLHDICAVIGDEFPDACLYIKPHPIQDVQPLRNFIQQSSYPVKICLTYDAPSLLASVADYAISTYSSTVIDTLSFNVPSIEYLKENDFFRNKHPAGSPFPALGAIAVSDQEELRECIRKLKAGCKPENKLIDALGHRENLSLFNVT